MSLRFFAEEDERPITPEVAQFIRDMSMACAWAAWVAESCLERHGAHRWMIQIEYGSITSMHCTICRTPLDYEHPSCSELLYAEIPVTVEIDWHTYPATPNGPAEYDCYVNAFARKEEPWESP